MHNRKVKTGQLSMSSRASKAPTSYARGNTGIKPKVNSFRIEIDTNNVRFNQRYSQNNASLVRGRSVIQDTSELPYDVPSYKVYASEAYRSTDIADRPLTNKACSFAPESHDFAQLTRGSFDPSPVPGGSAHDQYKNLLLEQYGFDPLLPDAAKLLKKVLCDQSPKVENSSQCANPDVTATYTDTMESPWQYVESVDDVDRYLERDPQVARHNPSYTGRSYPFSRRFQSSSTPTPLSSPILPFLSANKIRISETPRIKVIAEKFARFKKMNIEVKNLEQKIVCVEYDVYEADNDLQPVQVMRAFFSVTSNCNKCEDINIIPINDIPIEIRRRFDITEKELNDHNAKEIEIIDSKIPGNQSYIDDLKKVLKRKREICTKKNKTSLDLKSMYNMAKRDSPFLDHDFSTTNLLSKAELAEIRKLLKSSASGTQGINRRIVKAKSSKFDLGEMSESILTSCI